MTETLFALPDDRRPWQRATWEGGTRVRVSDPQTSRDAAGKAMNKAGTLRALVLTELRYGPKTHDELIAALPDWSASGVRTRCRELVEQGRVVADGHRVSAMGNRSIVWRAL